MFKQLKEKEIIYYEEKLFAVGTMMVLMICMLAGCGQRETASSKENIYTQDIMEQSSNTVGYPDVTNFFEKAQLKEIYELRDDPDLICFWYTRNDMTGKWIYQGECIGYGIPYTTQFTQPETMQRAPLPALNINGDDKGWNEYFTEVLPQADPNGLSHTQTDVIKCFFGFACLFVCLFVCF